MAAKYFEQDDGVIVCEVNFTEAQQGAPGHAHGGSIAAVLDETMGWAAWRSGYRVLAAKLEFEYRLPTPLGLPLKAFAWVVGKGKRSIRVECRLCLPDGRDAVKGRGVFVDLGDRFEEMFGHRWGTAQPGA